jgi:hypothetical protein
MTLVVYYKTLKGILQCTGQLLFVGYVAQRENEKSEEVYSVELLLKLAVTFRSRHLSVINMVLRNGARTRYHMHAYMNLHFSAVAKPPALRPDTS